MFQSCENNAVLSTPATQTTGYNLKLSAQVQLLEEN